MQFLNAQEYSDRFGVKYGRVLKLVKSGVLPTVKGESGKLFIKVDDATNITAKTNEILSEIKDLQSEILGKLAQICAGRRMR
jgi:predicted site-specific integrase-resolvase